MKTYTIQGLKKIAREQGYQMAGLENLNGERVVSFNKPKSKTINDQLVFIETRLNSEIYPDGVYNVLLSHNINKSRNPDRYPIAKGNLSESQITEIQHKIEPKQIVLEPTNLLSQEKALEMLTEISNLKARVKELEYINEQLENKVDELESESEGLSEQPTQINNVFAMLKEALPTLSPFVDRYFDLEDKKLELESLKLLHGVKSGKANNNASKGNFKPIEAGSQEHLQVIEFWYNSEKPEAEDKLNMELDRLKEYNRDLYYEVLNKLDLQESDETD